LIDQFIKLQRTYQDYFKKQKFLFQALVEVEELIEKNERELKSACNNVYSKYYLHFVAIRMTDFQFYSIAEEKILNGKSTLLN